MVVRTSQSALHKSGQVKNVAVDIKAPDKIDGCPKNNWQPNAFPAFLEKDAKGFIGFAWLQKQRTR
jgi:hypothetical protein